MEMEGSWGDDTVMGVDEVLDDPGVHGNISITFPGYSHMNYLRVGFFFFNFCFCQGCVGGGGREKMSGGEKMVLLLPPFSSSLSY